MIKRSNIENYNSSEVIEVYNKIVKDSKDNVTGISASYQLLNLLGLSTGVPAKYILKINKSRIKYLPRIKNYNKYKDRFIIEEHKCTITNENYQCLMILDAMELLGNRRVIGWLYLPRTMCEFNNLDIKLLTALKYTYYPEIDNELFENTLIRYQRYRQAYALLEKINGKISRLIINRYLDCLHPNYSDINRCTIEQDDSKTKLIYHIPETLTGRLFTVEFELAAGNMYVSWYIASRKKKVCSILDYTKINHKRFSKHTVVEFLNRFADNLCYTKEYYDKRRKGE